MDGKQQLLIEHASRVFEENFTKTTWFERALFFSWACMVKKPCKYCYMSTLSKEKRTKERVRSVESLIAEAYICKLLGWKPGFLSGGYGAYSDEKLIGLLKALNSVFGEKMWVNIGVLSEARMRLLKPHIKGIVGGVDVLNPKLHVQLCPSKPLTAMKKMFTTANLLRIRTGMTLIVGLGEDIRDFLLLKDFILHYHIEKIHIYGLNPQAGTVFEHSSPPSADYQAEWIARTRLAFPHIDIQAGIWLDRVARIPLLLKAGANSLSKFPAIRYFASPEAKRIEELSRLAGRKFEGTMSTIPSLPEGTVSQISLNPKVKEKLGRYLRRMKRNLFKYDSNVRKH